MPPVQPMEILAAFGILVGFAMFVIIAALFGVVVLIEKVVLRGKSSNLRLEQQNK